MKRFCLPIIFTVCIAGCLVETGCATLVKLADDTATVLLGGGVQETPDPTPPAPAIPTPEAEQPVVDDEPLVTAGSVPTWLAALLLLVGRSIPSKGVAPLLKSLGKRTKKILGG